MIVPLRAGSPKQDNWLYKHRMIGISPTCLPNENTFKQQPGVQTENKSFYKSKKEII